MNVWELSAAELTAVFARSDFTPVSVALIGVLTSLWSMRCSASTVNEKCPVLVGVPESNPVLEGSNNVCIALVYPVCLCLVVRLAEVPEIQLCPTLPSRPNAFLDLAHHLQQVSCNLLCDHPIVTFNGRFREPVSIDLYQACRTTKSVAAHCSSTSLYAICREVGSQTF